MEFVLRVLKIVFIIFAVGFARNCHRTGYFSLSKKSCESQLKELSATDIRNLVEKVLTKKNLDFLNINEKNLIATLNPIEISPFSVDKYKSLLLKFDTPCIAGTMVIYPEGNINYFYTNSDSDDLFEKTGIKKSDFLYPYSSNLTRERLEVLLKEYE